MPLKRIAVVTVIVIGGLATAGVVFAFGWTRTSIIDAVSFMVIAPASGDRR